VRELGVYAEVFPSDTPAARLAGRRGLIISGGPASVYEEGSPNVDPGIFANGAGVLGICYGQQLMAFHLGGKVQPGERGEYGLATLEVNEPGVLLSGTDARQQIWMSHRDLVSAPPTGFSVLAQTETCAIAAIAAPDRRLYGVQFHPEVAHTRHGRRILSNFLFDICGCRKDWDPRNRVPLLEAEIREAVGDRNVFFFVSGGVDSTVAYTLCLRALGPNRVSGFYVDTGLMREGETHFVRELFRTLGANAFMVEEAGDQFLEALAGVTDPERKRHIIGEQFVAVQERILRTGHFLEANWILGQGTIYPDTIESGGTAKADLIKTHHNRVAGIQKLIEEDRIVEPLTSFYKDEVREIGRELGLPERFLERHPFPGPGLAIRCLCSERELPIEHTADGWLIPVRSVGVQGDSRTYRSILAIEGERLTERATELINRIQEINRVVLRVAARGELRVTRGLLSPERLARLRAVDAVVRRVSDESGFEKQVWQFPVILIPVGTAEAADSVVLRPVDSVDGMTAAAVLMERALLERLAAELMSVDGIAAVFYDLTHKPPGTIEWE
jgi:GMP synthase (glutamine-hydrolysing)